MTLTAICSQHWLVSLVWDLSLGIFRLESFAWNLSLGNFGLGTFAGEPLRGASRLGSEAGGILFLRRGVRLAGAGGIGLAAVVSLNLRN